MEGQIFYVNDMISDIITNKLKGGNSDDNQTKLIRKINGNNEINSITKHKQDILCNLVNTYLISEILKCV